MNRYRMLSRGREFNPERAYIGDDSIRAPMPVIVEGYDGSFLGIGKIIGTIESDRYRDSVVEIEDIDNGEPTQLLAGQCIVSDSIPEEVIDSIAAGRLHVASVQSYIDAMRR